MCVQLIGIKEKACARWSVRGYKKPLSAANNWQRGKASGAKTPAAIKVKSVHRQLHHLQSPRRGSQTNQPQETSSTADVPKTTPELDEGPDKEHWTGHVALTWQDRWQAPWALLAAGTHRHLWTARAGQGDGSGEPMEGALGRCKECKAPGGL